MDILQAKPDAAWLTRKFAGVIANLTLAAALVAGSNGVANAQVDEARLAVGQPEQNGESYGLMRFAEYLGENAGIDVEVYLMSLLSLAEIPDGLRDGIVGIGNVVTAYKPAEYSETNLIANLSMLATAGENTQNPSAAMSGAVMEYVLFNCEDCLDQYRSMNQVFFGSASTNPYALLCTEPVTSLDDMRGKRFRSGASNFSRWAESVGASTVSIPGNEMYDALSQGIVDCTMLAVNELVGVSLIDVVNDVLLGVPGGVFAGLANNNANRDWWASLSDEQRRAYIDGTPYMVAHIIAQQNVLIEESLAAAEEQDVEVHDANETIMAAYNEFVADDLELIAREFTDQYGLDNVEEKIQIASDLIDKWKVLTADVSGSDVEAMATLYAEEIFSRIDVSTHGLD